MYINVLNSNLITLYRPYMAFSISSSINDTQYNSYVLFKVLLQTKDERKANPRFLLGSDLLH